MHESHGGKERETCIEELLATWKKICACWGHGSLVGLWFCV